MEIVRVGAGVCVGLPTVGTSLEDSRSSNPPAGTTHAALFSGVQSGRKRAERREPGGAGEQLRREKEQQEQGAMVAEQATEAHGREAR
eukprot:724576-Hanusia_phi.AAC.2